MVRRALLVAALAIFGLSTSVSAQQRRGWRVDDLLIELSVAQAVDSVTLTASWISRNSFPEEFAWQIPELVLSGIDPGLGVTLQIPQPDLDMDANFCVKTIRLSDRKESTEVCVGFQIPGVPVLPPDSVAVQVALLTAFSNSATARWDTVPGAGEYFVALESAAGEVGRSPFGFARRTPTAWGPTAAISTTRTLGTPA